MTETKAARPAAEVARGTVVVADVNGARRPCLKAERDGNAFVQHYLVPLDAAGDRTELCYVDPESDVTPVADPAALTLGAAESEGTAPGPGDAFTNARGTFIKLNDRIKGQISAAYVNLETGDIVRRQERGVIAVYRAWRRE